MRVFRPDRKRYGLVVHGLQKRWILSRSERAVVRYNSLLQEFGVKWGRGRGRKKLDSRRNYSVLLGYVVGPIQRLTKDFELLGGSEQR